MGRSKGAGGHEEMTLPMTKRPGWIFKMSIRRHSEKFRETKGPHSGSFAARQTKSNG